MELKAEAMGLPLHELWTTHPMPFGQETSANHGISVEGLQEKIYF